jgi:UDP-2,3-diacylglucosamine hydrolase
VKAVYFISDAHLGIESPRREGAKKAALLSFLEEVELHGAALYILGDLYDFWFEYTTGVSSNDSAVADALARLVKAGKDVTYIAGNHDYWLGKYWEKRGVKISRTPITAEIQGRTVFMAHGDGLGGVEPAYLLVKWLLRNRASISLYSRLGRRVGNGIALAVSKLSRAKSNKTVPKMTEGLHRYAMTKFKEGSDIVICGHIHNPTIMTENGRTFCLLGDWMDHFTYAKLNGGQLNLLSWPPLSEHAPKS